MKSHISQNKFSPSESFTEEELTNECDFLKYVKMLGYFAKKYCVIIAACDTPCGPALTPDISKGIMDIGLNTNLYNKFRCPYAAVIDKGVLLYENLETNTRNMLEANIKLDTKDKIEIISAGFDEKGFSKGIIKINGTNYSPNSRGLNFVVYDKFSKNVIDAVVFDTYSTGLFCKRPFAIHKFMEKIIQSHPGVTAVAYNYPKFPTEKLTENEKFIQNNKINYYDVVNNLKTHKFAISKYYDDEAAMEVLAVPRSYIDNTGVRCFEDAYGKHFNIIGGHRVTCYQPASDDDNICVYIYGPCHLYGVGASDEHTITSQLQKIANRLVPQYKIKVQSYGFFLMNNDNGLFDMDKDQIYKASINSLPLAPGDIILYDSDLFSSGNQIYSIDLSDAANEPRNYEVFNDKVHYTPDGYRLIAEKLYEGLMAQGILEKAREFASRRENTDRAVSNNTDFDKNTNEQLAEYKRFLADFYNSSIKQQTIGAVVMNCNPFTLGHRYLIDRALEQCSFLILFLVEEDKSEFSFDERLKLVDDGTKDIPNLAIIPSGKFVLSSLTFSEYFNKSELQDRVIDTSLDVNVFAREIAPCLHITKRFAGEEPLDNVTRQYNETMRKVLPEYGIEFVEIPRIELDSKPISASRVRELAKSGRFSELRELVPQTTLDYLAEKYKS